MNRPVWILLELFQLLVFLEFLVLLVFLELFQLLLLEFLQLLHVLPAFLFLLQSMGFFLTRAPSAFDPEVAACYELALVLRGFH